MLLPWGRISVLLMLLCARGQGERWNASIDEDRVWQATARFEVISTNTEGVETEGVDGPRLAVLLIGHARTFLTINAVGLSFQRYVMQSISAATKHEPDLFAFVKCDSRGCVEGMTVRLRSLGAVSARVVLDEKNEIGIQFADRVKRSCAEKLRCPEELPRTLGQALSLSLAMRQLLASGRTYDWVLSVRADLVRQCR